MNERRDYAKYLASAMSLDAEDVSRCLAVFESIAFMASSTGRQPLYVLEEARVKLQSKIQTQAALASMRADKPEKGTCK